MIRFDNETHTYTNEDGVVLVSVTQLLQKHGLSPDYSSVNIELLNRKAEHGNLVHALIEDYLHTGEIAQLDEVVDFDKWAKNHTLTEIHTEEIVTDGFIAGMFDVLMDIDGTKTLCDIKTTSAKHPKTWAWQLSLYRHLLLAMRKIEVKDMKVFWITDKGLEVVDIEPIPQEDIDRLISCEMSGEWFLTSDLDRQVIALERNSGLLAEAERIERAIMLIDSQKKAFEEQYDAIKEALITAMEDNGVKTFKTDSVTVTYVAPSESTTFDKDRFKKDEPDLFSKYNTKKSKRKAYVTIKVKD